MGIFKLQPFHDVSAGERIRRGRQCNARHLRVALVQHRERAVLGAKVVAPLAHAMGLINGKQAKLALLIKKVKLCQKPWRGQPLGRGVQQRDVPSTKALLHAIGGFATQAGIQKSGFDAGFMQRADLVVHERDQWRDHNAQAVPHALTRNGRNLVAQGFATPCGHEHQRIAAVGDVLDHRLLVSAKCGVAENFTQDGQCVVGR